MCSYLKEHGRCFEKDGVPRCHVCFFRFSDAEYGVLAEQEKRLKEALAITQTLMEMRLLKMRLEVKTNEEQPLL